LNAVGAVNAAQKHRLFELLSGHFAGQLADRTIAVWGLAFKPNTDDLREAPASILLQQLWAAGARVQAFDPEAGKAAAKLFGERADLVLCSDAMAAVRGADALVVVTEWKQFWSPNFAALKAALTTPVIFDGRNIFDPKVVEAAGIAYYGIGRGRSVRRG